MVEQCLCLYVYLYMIIYVVHIYMIIYVVYIYIFSYCLVIEGSLNSKLPTIWRVEKQMKSREMK